MPEPARHLWATLAFELDPPSAASEEQPLRPTLDEVADGYLAIGVAEAAQRLRGSASLRGLHARITAARSAYLCAHHAEIDAGTP